MKILKEKCVKKVLNKKIIKTERSIVQVANDLEHHGEDPNDKRLERGTRSACQVNAKMS